MRSWLGGAMVLWAARDLLRRPGQSVLFALCVALLCTEMAVPMLLTQAVADTARVVLRQAPSLVVRRVNAGGWTPLPGRHAARLALGVRGVTEAVPRIWGVARGPAGPVTVVGIELEIDAEQAAGRASAPELPPAGSLHTRALRQQVRSLPPGAALVGPSMAWAEPGRPVMLVGAEALELEVAAVLHRELSMVAHDLVLVRAEDARKLLGLGPEEASDLAVQVFHESEAEAIAPDLVEALPWPVQLSQRREVLGWYAGGVARRGGLAMLVMVPAIVGLVLLALSAWRDGLARRRELGLLKALGWSTSDVARLRAWRAAIVGVPAALLGLLVAYQAVFWPGASWLGELLLGWSTRPVELTLEPESASLVLLQVGATVLIPWFAASLWPVLRTAATHPEQLLTDQGGLA